MRDALFCACGLTSPAQMETAQACSGGLHEAMATIKGWAESLIASLDPASRSRLYKANTACRQSVLEAAQSATVTLLAYGGQSEAAWQRRLACAEQGLVLRGPQPNTKLVLRLPTPNPAAVQSILSVSEAAGRAVTELEVRQCQSSESRTEGVHTPWLQALPAAFPNLRTLRINRLCGCLPPPASLPHVTELDLHLIPRATPTPAAAAQASTEQDQPCSPAHTVHELCASIAPYLAQITTLTLSIESGRAIVPLAVPWVALFTSVSHTLTHFTTSAGVSDELVRLLCEYAPQLQRLCGTLGALWTGLNEDHSGATWAVTDVQSNCFDMLDLARLPSRPTGAAVVLLPDQGGVIRLRTLISDAEVGAHMHAPTRMGTHRHTHTHTWTHTHTRKLHNPTYVIYITLYRIAQAACIKRMLKTVLFCAVCFAGNVRGSTRSYGCMAVLSTVLHGIVRVWHATSRAASRHHSRSAATTGAASWLHRAAARRLRLARRSRRHRRRRRRAAAGRDRRA